MEIKLKKQIEKLEKEIILKSVDLDEDIKDFNVDIQDYSDKNKLITISPRCIRCDLCVDECPVDAIRSSTFVKRAKIEDNCVQCEICAQSCPISCIYVLNSEYGIERDKSVNYYLTEVKVPHRTLKMENISINRDICVGCGACTKFCPTNAITLKEKSFIESQGEKCPSLEPNSRNYSFVNKKLCVGCGSCANLCVQGAIDLKRKIGPVIIYNKIEVNQDTCVGCYLCEDNCPVGAIKLVNGEIVLDDNKCIRCKECSNRCPVGALELKMIE